MSHVAPWRSHYLADNWLRRMIHRPSVLFHAAAHKHVPMMEWNPGEAIKNNVVGTRTIALAAAHAIVKHFPRDRLARETVEVLSR